MKNIIIFQNILEDKHPTDFKYKKYIKKYINIYAGKNILRSLSDIQTNKIIIEKDFFNAEIVRRCEYKASKILKKLKQSYEIKGFTKKSKNSFISNEKTLIRISAIIYYQELSLLLSNKYDLNLKETKVLPFFSFSIFKTYYNFDSTLYYLLKRKNLINKDVNYSNYFLFLSYIINSFKKIYCFLKILVLPELQIFKIPFFKNTNILKNIKFNNCYDIESAFLYDEWPYNLKYFIKHIKENDLLFCRGLNLKRIPREISKKFDNRIIFSHYDITNLLEYFFYFYSKFFLQRFYFIYLSILNAFYIDDLYEKFNQQIKVEILFKKIKFKKIINFMTRTNDYELNFLFKKNVIRYFVYWSSTELQFENKIDMKLSSTNDYADLQYDKIFCSKVAKFYLGHQNNNNENIIDIGNFFSDAIIDGKKSSDKIIKDLGINNKKIIITIFDQKSNFKNILNHKEYKYFLNMIGFLLSKKIYYVLFKSKNYYATFEKEIEDLRSKIYEDENFFNLNKSEVSHLEALSVSDLSISCPLSSTSIESMSGRVKTIIFDPIGLKNYNHCITNKIPNLYCKSLSELEKLIQYYIDLNESKFEEFIKNYTLRFVDSFADHNSINRFNKYLQ